MLRWPPPARMKPHACSLARPAALTPVNSYPPLTGRHVNSGGAGSGSGSTREPPAAAGQARRVSHEAMSLGGGEGPRVGYA